MDYDSLTYNFLHGILKEREQNVNLRYIISVYSYAKPKIFVIVQLPYIAIMHQTPVTVNYDLCRSLAMPV